MGQAETTTAPSPYLDGTLIQWAYDSQSLGAAMECPRKYFYGQLRGLRRKKHKTTLTFGQAFHKAMEVYQITGSLDQAQLESQKVVREAGGMDEHQSRTPESLARSINAYIAHHAKEELETLKTSDGKAAVELHFKVPLGTVSGVGEVAYCGYIDRAVKFQDTPYCLDSKTTGQSISTEKGHAAYFASFTPDNQFTGYCYGAREAFGFPVRGVILDAMQVAKTKTEFARDIVHRTPAQVDEWVDGALRIVRQTVAYAEEAQGKDLKEQEKIYPMNRRACHSRYGACTFAGICGRDPSVRENFLSTDFEVKLWNPLEIRQGDTLKVGEDVAVED